MDMTDRIINIMGRGNAIRYCEQDHFSKSIMISVSNPLHEYDREPFTSKTNNIIDILRLSFVDADSPGDLDVYGKKADMEHMFSDEQAQQVVEFVKKYPDENIIIHCDAGISRSSAIAAAILRYYSGNDDAVFNSRYYCPNMWVYYKCLKAFEIEYGIDGEVEADI